MPKKIVCSEINYYLCYITLINTNIRDSNLRCRLSAGKRQVSAGLGILHRLIGNPQKRRAEQIGILAFFTVINMANEIIYLTAEGMQKLKDELHHMRSVERPAISAAIAEARDKGDLSENAEYDAAREAQGLLELKIAKLEQTLTNARIIDESKIDKSKVQILSKVTLLNHNNNKQVTYTIVSENEANLREGKLAIGTPIAKALLGKKKGDVVEVTVPAGLLKFEILDINI